MSVDFLKLLKEERYKYRKGGSSAEKPNASNIPTDVRRDNNAASIQCPSIPLGLPLSATRAGGGQCRSTHVGIGSIKSLFYIKEFVNEQQAEAILENINNWGNSGAWTSLRTRKLQCWGDGASVDDNEGMPASLSLPTWLLELVDHLVQQEVFVEEEKPNHVLINQYAADQGILHHTDGPKYRDKVAILSLQTPCIMTFRRNLKPEEIGNEYGGDVFSVVLEPRSLLVFEDLIYNDYMHGIASDVTKEVITRKAVPCVNEDIIGEDCKPAITRGPRTSLTFRRTL